MEEKKYGCIKSIENKIEKLSNELSSSKIYVLNTFECYLDDICKNGVIEKLPLVLDEIDIDFWSEDDEKQEHYTLGKVYKK